MLQHVSSLHERKNQFKCGICNYTSHFKGTLNRHVATVHEGIKKACVICDFRCSRSANMKKHVLSTHEGKKKQFKLFKCTVCDKLLFPYGLGRLYL